jgi:hypothetical protein
MMFHEISDSPADEYAGSVGHPLRPMVTVAVGDLPAWLGVCAGVIHDRLGRIGVEHHCGVSIWARNGEATARVSDGCEDAAERGQDQDDEIGGVEPVQESGPADAGGDGSPVATAAIVVSTPPCDRRARAPARRRTAWHRETQVGGAVAPPSRIRSGARNPGDPITTPAWVSDGSPSAVAIPKSVSTVRPPGQSSTLLGFTSRCSTPAACAAASASSSCLPTAAARSAATARRPRPPGQENGLGRVP